MNIEIPKDQNEAYNTGWHDAIDTVIRRFAKMQSVENITHSEYTRLRHTIEKVSQHKDIQESIATWGIKK